MRAAPAPGTPHDPAPSSDAVIQTLQRDLASAPSIEAAASSRRAVGPGPEWTLGRPWAIALAIGLAVLMWLLVAWGWLALR